MTEYASGLATTSLANIGYGCQNKIMKIKGRLWILVGDDGLGGMYLLSTLNYQTFTSTYLGDIGFNKGRGASMAYDSNADILHFTWEDGASTVRYNACTPNSDGTATLLSTATQRPAGAGSTMSACITLDTDGYPWIIYYKIVLLANELTVIKSSTKNGIWITDAAITKILHTTAADVTYTGGIPVPQTDGKMYFIYTKPYGDKVYGWQYDPSTGWAVGEDTISASNAVGLGIRIDAVADGDDIHMVFEDTTDKVQYQKFTYGAGWSGETLIEAADTGGVAIALNSITSDLYIHFTSGVSNILHRWRYKDSAWSELSTVSLTEPDPDYCGNLRNVGGVNLCIYQGVTSRLVYFVAYGILSSAVRSVSCGL